MRGYGSAEGQLVDIESSTFAKGVSEVSGDDDVRLLVLIDPHG